MIPRRLKLLFHQISFGDQAYCFLFEAGPADEVVAFDCETTGLSVAKDDIIVIAAVKVRGNRILASEKFEAVARPEATLKADSIKVHRLLESDVESGGLIMQIIPDFLSFIGGRPLVGYYIDFDIAMLNNHVSEMLGIQLPNPRIEVSSIYYERKYSDAPPGTQINLTFANILRDLKLPLFNQHDAFSDALMTAMIYVNLKDYVARDIRIPRPRIKPAQDYHGM